MSPCEKSEALRDYAFNELPPAERQEMERHVETCESCAAELDNLQLTTAALRVIPDQEIPRRIAFVSDKVFEPSWFARLWNSGARLGFASACVIAAAWAFSVAHRPSEVRTVVTAASGQDITKQLNAAIAQAVAQAVSQTRAEDAQLTKAALESDERKHREEHQAILASMEESMTVMQKQLGVATTLASLEVPQSGGGQ